MRALCTGLTPGQVNAFLSLSLCVSVSVSLPLSFSAKLEAVTHSAELHHWQAEAPAAVLQVLISADSFIPFNLGGGKALFLKQIAGKGSLVLVPSHFLQPMDSRRGEWGKEDGEREGELPYYLQSHDDLCHDGYRCFPKSHGIYGDWCRG